MMHGSVAATRASYKPCRCISNPLSHFHGTRSSTPTPVSLVLSIPVTISPTRLLGPTQMHSQFPSFTDSSETGVLTGTPSYISVISTSFKVNSGNSSIPYAAFSPFFRYPSLSITLNPFNDHYFFMQSRSNDRLFRHPPPISDLNSPYTIIP